MRRLLDKPLGGVAAVFIYPSNVEEGLELFTRVLAEDYGADLLGAGHWLEPDEAQTELLFGYFKSVEAAKDFLEKADSEARQTIKNMPHVYTIYDGDKTMAHRPEHSTLHGGYLIINGERVFVPGVTIHNFVDTGMRFIQPRGVHPRPAGAVVDKITLHSTGSERVGAKGAKDLLRNMSARRDAGCHIFIENGGEVWQFADLVRDMTTHVSHRVVKVASIGFEVSNYQWKKNHDDAPSAGRDRPKYEATIHKWRTTHADYYPAQQASVLALCTAICDHLVIPKQVLRAPWRVRSNKTLRAFKGVHAHLHCALGENPKTCPGTGPLDALAASWGLD